jgi:hypothetical protein
MRHESRQVIQEDLSQNGCQEDPQKEMDSCQEDQKYCRTPVIRNEDRAVKVTQRENPVKSGP